MSGGTTTKLITVTDSLEVALTSKDLILAQGLHNHGGGSSPCLGLVSNVMDQESDKIGEVRILIRPEIERVLVGSLDSSLKSRTLALCRKEIESYVKLFPTVQGFIVDIPLLPTIDLFTLSGYQVAATEVAPGVATGLATEAAKPAASAPDTEELFDVEYFKSLREAAQGRELWLNRSIPLVPKRLRTQILEGLKEAGLEGILVPFVGGSKSKAMDNCLPLLEECRDIGLKAIVLPVRKVLDKDLIAEQYRVHAIAVVRPGANQLDGSLLPWNYWDVACNLIHAH